MVTQKKTRQNPRWRSSLSKERAYELVFCDGMVGLVRSWLHRLGVLCEHCGDVAQAVMLTAHRKFHTYDPERARPERWLNQITVHVAAHYGRRMRRQREVIVPLEELDVLCEEPGGDERMAAREEEEMVRRALAALDERASAVLTAHDIEGLPMVDVAAWLGVPVSTAYKWRARGLAAFRSLILTLRAAAEPR